MGPFIMKLINLLIRELNNCNLGGDFRVSNLAEVSQFDSFSSETRNSFPSDAPRACNYPRRIPQLKCQGFEHQVFLLLKSDKLPSFTTSYRPISSIMKLFERVIEQRLRSHLEKIGLLNKHQLVFRRAKYTNDHQFRLSKSIMESFNRGEHVVAAFLDVQKAFHNVWHNGLRYKIFQLDLPTKMTRWLFEFLVGRVIQINVNGFLSN